MLGVVVLSAATCTKLGWASIDGHQVAPDTLVMDFFDTEPVRQMKAVPLWYHGELCWAVKDPLAVDMVNLRLLTHQPFSMALVYSDTWQVLLEKMISCREGRGFDASDGGGRVAGDASMWPYCHLVLSEACMQGCSDIHLVSEENQGVVRFRQDGLLRQYVAISSPRMRAMIGCLKHAGGMDVTETRLPQGGRLQFCLRRRRVIGEGSLGGILPDEFPNNTQASLAVRLNTLPGAHGETMLLRLLRNQPLSLDALGITRVQRQSLELAVKQPQGLIVFVGPTGCGKSSTLHALLMCCDREQQHVVTLEDPLEATLDHVHQVPMRPAIGLDFAEVLPHVLRSDPDILMVGEVRDAKTARLVLSAAQTGHLVLTTVHGASMFSALKRLQQLGGCCMALSNAVNLLVEQRLLRSQP